MVRMLSPTQQQQYQAQGYLVLPGFRSAEAVASVRARAAALVNAFDVDSHRSVFATDDQARRSSDAAFLASAEGVQCFFEAEAFDEQGRLRRPKAECINKIGHALHDLDPVFDAFSHGQDLQALAQDLSLAEPQVWQSMLIFKPPGIGGEVKWHQDATFLDTRPTTVTGFWFALEDADQHNGCLWVQPGGHRSPLRERFVREGDRVRMDTLDSTPWPQAGDGSTVPVEVPAGSLVVFHGLLPHWSAPNRSARSRSAYTLHATDALAHYTAQNWLQRPSLALRSFMPR